MSGQGLLLDGARERDFKARFYAIFQPRLLCCLPKRPERDTQIADYISSGQSNQNWQAFVWLLSFTQIKAPQAQELRSAN